MTQRRYIDLAEDQQLFHLVIKAVGKGHKNDDWLFCGRRRDQLLDKFKLYLKLFPAFSLLVHTGMSSHFHWLIKADYTHQATRSEVKAAYEQIYGGEVHVNGHQVRSIIRDQHDLSKLMQRFLHDTAWQFNREKQKKYRRTGHLWAERFHLTLLESASALMCCTRYILMNPVKAGIADTPVQWKWNSLNDPQAEEMLEALRQAYNSLENLGGQVDLDQFRSLLTDLIRDAVTEAKELRKAKKLARNKSNKAAQQQLLMLQAKQDAEVALWRYSKVAGDPQKLERFDRPINESDLPDLAFIS